MNGSIFDAFLRDERHDASLVRTLARLALLGLDMMVCIWTKCASRVVKTSGHIVQRFCSMGFVLAVFATGAVSFTAFGTKRTSQFLRTKCGVTANPHRNLRLTLSGLRCPELSHRQVSEQRN
jgi:hypothetical protein